MSGLMAVSMKIDLKEDVVGEYSYIHIYLSYIHVYVLFTLIYGRM